MGIPNYIQKLRVLSCILLISLTLSSCGSSSILQQPEKPVEQTGAATVTPDFQKGMNASQNYDLLKGVGILGDSSYDEYQADDNRGGDFHNVTFNMLELLVKHRGFNLGPWGTWGDARRTGYKYNWARSGSTSSTLVQSGQHTGLAEQIRAGEVTFVFISVGTNDFSPHFMSGYDDIYSGKMSDADVEAKVNAAISNMTEAVSTVKAAGAKGVMMMTFPQWEIHPAIVKQFPNAAGRKRVYNAIEKINRGLIKMGKEQGIVVLDQTKILRDMLSRVDKDGFITVGGERIDVLNYGDEPHHATLGDAQHNGTVMNGIFANNYFIGPLQTNFNINIPPLTDEEMLESAGLR